MKKQNKGNERKENQWVLGTQVEIVIYKGFSPIIKSVFDGFRFETKEIL